MTHNYGLPITQDWENGYESGMQDAADMNPDFRPYVNPNTDWRRGYNDAYADFTGTKA